jgi:pimeloyl-ACP methyl ester carboxylesterase
VSEAEPEVPASIHVRTLGAGPTVVLVHGTLTTSRQTWERQEPLADRWTLVIPDRRGYEPNPYEERSDFEVDAADIAPLLGEGGHLVGHSCGAVGATFAAVRRPDAVRSLTLIEPPGHSLLRGHPDVERQIDDQDVVRQTIHEPEGFMRAFLGFLGAPTDSLPSPLPPALERQVRLLMGERPPWDLPLPVEAVRAAGFPVLVVSGGHNDTFELVCDHIAEAIGPAAERAVLPGRGHVVQRLGEPFNARLEELLRRGEADATA